MLVRYLQDLKLMARSVVLINVVNGRNSWRMEHVKTVKSTRERKTMVKVVDRISVKVLRSYKIMGNASSVQSIRKLKASKEKHVAQTNAVMGRF